MKRRLLFVFFFAACLGACGGSRSKPTPPPEAAPPPPAAEPAATGQVPPAKPAEKAPARTEPAPPTRERAGARPAASTATTPPAPQNGKAATPPPPEKAAEPSASSTPPDDGRSAREHVLEAMKMLDKGDAEGAWVELNAAVRVEPGNEAAALLMKQMDADPEEMLGKEYFSYTTQGGDTLSKIAKKFLNDDRKFYILARYNGIRVPRDLAAGQVLKIPGKRPAGMAKPAPAPQPKEAAPAPPPPAPKPVAKEPAPPKPAEPESNADKLYQSGVQAAAAGAPDKAYDLLTQALKANPKHAGAQDKLREIRTGAVDAYYKKAVASFRRHDLDETIRYCNKALEIDPDNEKVKLRRAEALELQEKMKNLK